MTRVRWVSNLEVNQDGLPPYRPFRIALIAYLISLLTGFVCQVISLSLINEDSGIVMMIDIMLMPLSSPFIVIIFLALQSLLIRAGYFGLATSTMLGAFCVFLVTSLGVHQIGGFSSDTSSEGLSIDLAISINFAITYGCLLGTLYWLRIAQLRPSSFIMGGEKSLVIGNWVMSVVILIMIWQQIFWRVG